MNRIYIFCCIIYVLSIYSLSVTYVPTQLYNINELITKVQNCTYQVPGTNHPKVHHEKISYKASLEPPMNQGTIEWFWDYFYAIYLLFDDSIRYRWQKMHQIEVETLTLKYDIIDLELRGGEFRNGTSVKNWARDNIGGSPM